MDHIHPAPVVDRQALRALRERTREQGRSIVLCNGAFDLLHVGHLRYLREAAKHGDILVAAVNSDKSVRASKGRNRPVVPQAERAELLAALRCVDVIHIFDETDVVEVIRTLQPDVHAKGTDYTEDSVPERAVVEAFGGRVVITGDPKNHSTTDTISRLQR